MSDSSMERMGPAEWDRLEALFGDAIELAAAERSAFVDQVCAAEPALRQQLLALLDAHQALGAEESDGAGFLRTLDTERAAALVGADPQFADAAAAGAAGEKQPGADQRIGRYHVLRTLGRGGMGVVHLGEDPRLRRHAAIKVLAEHLTRDPAANQRFVAEARAASALDHPNIATVYEIGETDAGDLFIAMAYYPGETLRQRLARGPLDIAVACGVATQLARALAAAHERAIVHRDVKPENVLITTGGTVKLLDFGIAKVAAAGAAPTGATLGTVAYMSPEQTRAETVGPPADLWSLGVVLYEMLAGIRPFAGAATDAVLFAIRNDPHPPLSMVRSEVPPALAELVDGCLAKSPADRPPSAGWLADCLEALGQPSGVTPPPRVRRVPLEPRKRMSRSRWVVAAGAMAVLLSGAAATTLLPVARPTGDGQDVRAGREPATEGAVAPRAWVVLADIDAAGQARDIGPAVREALSVDLQQSRFVNVYARGQVASVLRSMDRAPHATLDLPTALEVAERTGAGAVVSVALTTLGSDYVLTARAVRPADGAELFAVRTTTTPDALLHGVEQLSRQLRQRLGEEGAAIRRSRPLPDVTTRSLPALKVFGLAEQAAHERDDATAAALLAEAIRLDPGFAMAHRAAAILANNQLRFGDAAAHMERAYSARERLTDRERWHVEAIYHGLVTVEPRRAAESYALLLARYPDDARASINLASTLHTWLNDHERAWDVLSRVDRRDPQAWAFFGNAAHLAFMTGRLEEAEQLAEAAEARGFHDVASRWRIGRAFALGQHRSAAAMCDTVLSGPARVPGAVDDRELCGSMDVAAGRLRLARARLLEVEPFYLEHRRYRNVAHVAQSLAMADLMRGEPNAAAARIAAVLTRIPADSIIEPDRFITRTSLQIQAALLGRPDLVQRIASAYPPYASPDHRLSRVAGALVSAALAVANGDGQAAVTGLRQELPDRRVPVGWRIWDDLLRGLAFQADDQPDSAAVYLRSAADPAYHAFEFTTKDRVYLPYALRRLAQAELARGDSVGAAAAYGRLLDLWADADPELHGETAEVRRALARLRAEPATEP